MKRGILFGLMCAVAGIMAAQTVHDNELAVVYYMPQTQLCFDVEYEEVTLHSGPFAAYAKQYLGAVDVIEKDETSFRIVKVHPFTKAVPDYTRAHKVVAERGFETQLLSLTELGTLAGYNITPDEDRQEPECPFKCDKPFPPHPTRPAVMPLLEEHLNNKTLQQQAQGAAKLIYRIRENRMYLLGGEVDKVPSDGQAMQIVLDELNRQERQLVELFIGYREVKKHHKLLSYTPAKTEEVELAFFSEKEGFTTGSGEPVLLNITARRQARGNSRPDADKKGPAPSQICYNLPGSANYRVIYLSETLVERNTPIAQFGIAVPLSKELFMQNKEQELPHIAFDKETGNIKSITK